MRAIWDYMTFPCSRQRDTSAGCLEALNWWRCLQWCQSHKFAGGQKADESSKLAASSCALCCQATSSLTVCAPAGIASYLEPLLQPSLELTWPLASQLLPHQTLLQPSAAAANLPLLLSSLGAQQPAHAAAAGVAEAGSSSTAAVLCNGCYCCATPSWQSMGSLQLLALQVIATFAGAGCAQQQQQASCVQQQQVKHTCTQLCQHLSSQHCRCYGTVTLSSCHTICILLAFVLQGEQCGQVMLHLQPPRWGAGGVQAEARCMQLLWCHLQPGLQLCLLSNEWPLQLFGHSIHQLCASSKLDAAALAPLPLPHPALAVVVADAGRNWVTFNTANK